MSTHDYAAKASFPFTGNGESRVVDHQACIALARTMRALAFIRLMTALGAFLKHRVIDPIKNGHYRRELRNSLMLLDDRLLADIGINRWEISGIVAAAVRSPVADDASTIGARAVKMDAVNTDGINTDAVGDTAANDDSGSLAA